MDFWLLIGIPGFFVTILVCCVLSFVYSVIKTNREARK